MVNPFSTAAGFAMAMPIPMWDLLIEKIVLQNMIYKVCAENGIVVSDGAVFKLSQNLLNGVLSKQLTGRALKLLNISLYIGGGFVVNALFAAGLMSYLEYVLRTHLQNENNIESLTEEKVRSLFLLTLKNPQSYLTA